MKEVAREHDDGAGADLRDFDVLEELADDGLGRDLLGLGLVGEDDAVAQDVDAHGLDVLGRDVAAVAQEGVRARRGVEVDRGAQGSRQTR